MQLGFLIFGLVVGIGALIELAAIVLCKIVDLIPGRDPFIDYDAQKAMERDERLWSMTPEEIEEANEWRATKGMPPLEIPPKPRTDADWRDYRREVRREVKRRINHKRRENWKRMKEGVRDRQS